MHKRSNLQIRDPYVVKYNDYYYMYNTKGPNTVFYYKSKDLNNWEECGTAVEIPKDDDFWAETDVWATEVHEYNSKFYLFVSHLGKSKKRGTQVYVSKTPAGPFKPTKNGPITPFEQSCIDATLFIDDNETPYIVYSHDWPDCFDESKNAYVGEIWAAQVDKELLNIVGEPFMLFKSDESIISKNTPDEWDSEGKHNKRFGSDGPFIQKMKNGKLYMTWSPYLNDNYVVLSVISESGDIKGPWVHSDTPLFDNNGGHAMFFDDFDGNRIMSIHAPEAYNLERAHFYRVTETSNGFSIEEEISFD